MSNIISYTRHISLLFLCFLLLCCSTGCSEKPNSTSISIPDKALELRDNTPKILSTEAAGTEILGNETIRIDVSNIDSGYIVLTYSRINEKVKFQIWAPNEVTYTYLITNYEEPIVYPLTGGNGTHLFSLLESVDAKKDLYAIAFSQEAEVSIADEFLPYLTPNVMQILTQTAKLFPKARSLQRNVTVIWMLSKTSILM